MSSRFPDPKGFFEKMNGMGINVIPNLKPGILKNHPYMPLFEKNGVFVKTPDGSGDYYGRWWGGEGRFFDFTGKAGRDTWKQLLEDNLLKLGAKTVWRWTAWRTGTPSAILRARRGPWPS